jgi:peptidoglycan/xylan/chitin deacetylase (PgdA/CDA1 family)/GT2 family glycosyltransferase
VIEQTLPTVLDQTFPADEYEVIVVVDGSTDGTADALRLISSPVRFVVIEQDNHGQAAARNAGLMAASGELVLFLDDDLFCERSLVAEHVSAHNDRNSLVFGPILVAPQSPDTLATKWLKRVTQDWLSKLQRRDVNWPENAFVGANSSMRRDTLVAIGGFDEQFFRALEDWELGQRLWGAGVRFRFCSAAVTHQLYVKTTDDVVLRDVPLYGTNEFLLCRKHPEYRRYSTFSYFSRGGWLKRKVLELSMRLPLSIDPLLKMAERSVRISSALGMRIFYVRQRLTLYRSLLKAFGSWDDIERDCLKVLPVLYYHRVGPALPGTYPALTVEPGRFKKQIAWLKQKGYTTIRAGDWLAWCLEGKPLPPKPVLLTFDDAYADLVEHAFPALREQGFTATVFVVTGEIGGSNSWDIKQGSASIGCMGADDMLRWSEEGIEFGAHSRTHTDLTTLSAPDLEEEIAGSGADLAGILGAAPRSFAYPFGYYNDGVLNCAMKTFQFAFTCEEGLNVLGTEPHLLRRAMVQPGDSLLDFGLRVKFGFNPIDRLIDRVRCYVKFRTRLKGLFSPLKGS